MWFLEMNYVTWLALLIGKDVYGVSGDRLLEVLKSKIEGVKTVVTADITLLSEAVRKNSKELERIGDLLTLRHQNIEPSNISNENNQLMMAQGEIQAIFQDKLEELNSRITRAFSREKADMKQLMGEVRHEMVRLGSELKSLVDELRENQTTAGASTVQQFESLQVDIDRQFTDLKARTEANIDELFKGVQTRTDELGKQVEHLRINITNDMKSSLEAIPNVHDLTDGYLAVKASSVGWHGRPEYALNGIRTGLYTDDEPCYHSADPDSHPWWEVSLKQQSNIRRLVITNRLQGQSKRFRDITIYVGDKVCASYPGPAGSQQLTIEIRCTREDLFGRTVRIVKDGTILTLCEVEIYVY